MDLPHQTIGVPLRTAAFCPRWPAGSRTNAGMTCCANLRIDAITRSWGSAPNQKLALK
jgi:hypothetical protein